MVLFLTAVSGIAWTIVYIASIQIGVKQETYAIPVAALALNIAWESIYTVHGLATDVSLQAVINLVWAMADVAIVYTYFRYGRRELPNFVTRPMFVAWGIAIFVTAYVVQWLFVLEFDWSQAARYSAFLQNLLMSGLFIASSPAEAIVDRAFSSRLRSGSAPSPRPSSSAPSKAPPSSSPWASCAACSTSPTSA